MKEKICEFSFLNLILWICAGAGVVTGYAGLSAAVVITPVLVSLCAWDSYNAVTVALASDVLASLRSVYPRLKVLGHFTAGFTLDTYTHVTNETQRGAAEKIGGFMESVTATTTPEPPDQTEESRCKVIPLEKVG